MSSTPVIETTRKMTRYASYIRISTTKQTTGTHSQRGAIREWFADRDLADWDEYEQLCQMTDSSRDIQLGW